MAGLSPRVRGKGMKPGQCFSCKFSVGSVEPAVCTFGGHWIPLRGLRLKVAQCRTTCKFPLGLSPCMLGNVATGVA